jgi:hypothetical protein
LVVPQALTFGSSGIQCVWSSMWIGYNYEATKELKSELEIDVYIETMRNVLREASLSSVETILKLALSIKNVKERLEFS